MKKLVLLLFSIFLIITSCNKDDDTNPDNSPQYNELGLQIGVKPINQDTLVVYSPTAIEIVNQVPTTNDFGTEYTINVEATNPEKIKKGNVIVDYSNGGRLWIIKNVPSSTSGRTSGITAILGSLDTFFTNAIVEVATPTNRAKNASTNPNKLESGKFKLYSGTDPLVTVNLPNISINEQSVADGVTLSLDNNTVNVNLSNVQLYSNSSNTFNVTIPEGSLQVNNAVDMRYKYLPLSTVLVGVPVNIGSLKEFDSSIYTTIDTNVKLDIEATTNGTVNLIDPIEKELGSYTKIIPIPPYFAASVRVSLKAKLTVTADAQLNITPEISTKNNFEARASYDGLFSVPTFEPPFYENIETNLANSINGDFNLNQRLEIIPEVEVYAFGLLGPKGELITYQEFNANATIQNAPLTWDTEIDLGVDYNTSLDVSIFHIDQLTGSIASNSGNVFNYDLFTSPQSTEVTLGNSQTGEVNTTLSTPIEIEVKNSAGETVAGVPVFFETTDGSFTSDYITTDAGGVAINSWTLGSTVGTQNASVYVKDGNGNIMQTTEINLSATAENATTINPVNTPLPTNGATDITLNGNLSFTEGANTPTDATFKIYFDTNTNPTTVYNLDANTNTLSYTNLQEGTQYYWYVETISSTNTVIATSPIWSFSTLTNTANTEPVTNPNPNNGATDIALNGNLSFTAGANTPTNANYRLYFDTNTSPTTQFDLGNQTSYNYSILQENTTYYWFIETLSSSGDVLATSNTWNFTTENNASGGIYNGDAILTTQQEVNDFGANNYSEITGRLQIGGNSGAPSDITDLNPLNSIQQIGGNLYVIYCPNLQNLNGLNSITYLNEDLIIQTGPGDVLNNVDALSSLTSIGGNLDIGYTTSLININGLSSLQTVSGSVKIERNSSLQNLDGFSSLQSIGGDLRIGGWFYAYQNNINLTNIDGLSSLNSIGGDLMIGFSSIQNLNGFSSLTTIGNELRLRSNSFTNLQGLNSLNNVESITLLNNDNLQNIDALNNINNLSGGLYISENEQLLNVNGLTNLTTVTTIVFRDNQNLQNIDGLSSLNNVTDINIELNPSLQDINGLSSLPANINDFSLLDNDLIANINALNNLSSVNALRIRGNNNLSTLSPLSNLNTVTDLIQIKENNSLTNLQGLESLQTVNGDLSIESNQNLIELAGLNNLTSINGKLRIEYNDSLLNLDELGNLTSITDELRIRYNSILTNFCGISNLINNGTLSGNYVVNNNAYNPTQQDIIDGNCSQ